MTPFTTGRYVRRHRIATGGMGEVWLAHDEVLHRDVAVKYLKREYSDDEGFHTRFLTEARTAASLHHPGIATVFDFGESQAEDGLPFLVMEYVDGRPLDELLAAGPLDPATARDYLHQAATALAEAHSRDLVHRDIKPGNLLVTDEGVVKITDFGIARAGDGIALTETGQLIGTPSYISPEQAEGQAATPASDVYALGVVLFECLTGRRPYVADSPVAIALAHIREPVPDLPPEIPEGLAAVTARALAKDPAERYADATELAAALESLGPEQTMVLATPVAMAATAGALASRPPGRIRWAVMAAAALALLVVGALALAALTGDETKDTPGPGSATPSQSVSPTTVRVDPAAYVGKPVAEVRAALVALGLQARRVDVDNPGGRTAGTVSALRPTGAVATGTTVTLEVWGAAPKAATDNGGKPEPDKGKGKGKGKGKKN